MQFDNLERCKHSNRRGKNVGLLMSQIISILGSTILIESALVPYLRIIQACVAVTFLNKNVVNVS